MTDIITAADDDGKTQRIASSTELPQIGQWYWVGGTEGDEAKWFGCVTESGSNYTELKGPAPGRGQYRTRIHHKDTDVSLQLERDHKRVLEERIKSAQNRVDQLMNEVNQLTRNLGVATVPSLGILTDSASTGLATLSGAVDIARYKQDLITAKEKRIPELKNDLRAATETLSSWLRAELIPVEAMADSCTDVIGGITDRIFNIELYAGFVEQAVQFADGAPAFIDEKLRVFQRLLYCDEEALLAYDDGGMDIQSMGDFEEWLSLPANRDRLLPYPRCLVAMRIRRTTKERDWDGRLSNLFMNEKLGQMDALTYLFVRNGERLYRISTGIEFDELIFPGLSTFDPAAPMMIKMFGDRIDKMMLRREYDYLNDQYQAGRANHAKWCNDNPREEWEAANPDSYGYHYANPHRDYGYSFKPDDWHPFDNTSVYFDEGLEKIAEEVKKYNRVSVIIQGLFDRSECLAPHKPVKTWTSDGFREAIELIYDGMGLTHGDPPCFETYRLKCNALIDEGSVLVGQEKAWIQSATEIECRRLDNDWRNKSDYRPKNFKPYGDNGPGYLAQPSKVMKLAKKAVFVWQRERRTNWINGSGHVRATITVPFSELFNVSAYKQGDYKIFFRDPRSREHYLQWAPMLMAAEDYHLKGKKVQLPIE